MKNRIVKRYLEHAKRNWRTHAMWLFLFLGHSFWLFDATLRRYFCYGVGLTIGLWQYKIVMDNLRRQEILETLEEIGE